MSAVDVLAFVEALARSWSRASVGLRAAADGDSAARRVEHHAGLVEAVRRVTEPSER